MAEELQYASRLDNKRKFDDPPRRPSGFSAGPVAPASSSPEGKGPAGPVPSYNSVPPPPDDIQLAKMRAQEIAARIFSAAESKRPRLDGDGVDAGGGGDLSHKPMGQPIAGTQVGGLPLSASSYQGTSKKIDIPNDRVGVIIGKGGETIKYLQMQSGAKIQVTRDMDADPNSQTRLVELMGTSDQISKAEQLISDVLTEAESGASGIITARKFMGAQVGSEHFVMLVPNNKVGLIIGKGGETIKNMQAKSGARIQIIPLHLPPGDTSAERTVHIDGTADQIESAKQLVNEVMSENRVKNPQTGGYPQHGYRPPHPPTHWGPPAPPPVQQSGYGYTQPGSYPPPPPQYNMSQPPYSGYPPQPTTAGYSSGWDQSSVQSQQSVPGSGYDYYNQQGQVQQQPPATGGSSAPLDSTGGYNYGQIQPPSYDSQPPYNETTYSQQQVGQQQGYGGYQAPSQQQSYSNPPPNAQPGYDQQSYNAAAPYSTMTTTTQDGSVPAYAMQGGSTQVPPAQQVPPVQTTTTQQSYTQQPSTTAPTYVSQAGPGYGVSPTSQPGYGMPPTSQVGYGAPPTSQPGYGNQLPSSAGYGQPSPLNQPGYGQSPMSQKPSTQAGYSQPSLQSGYGGSAQAPAAKSSYGGAAPPVGYGSGSGHPGYSQQQSYSGPPTHAQPAYGQQPQPYGDSYGAGGYSQPPYAADGAAGGSGHGAYDGQAPSQVVSSGVSKASPNGKAQS